MVRRRGVSRSLDEIGRPPDPRFTFANERTFLAWNRTALALIAAGLGAAQFLHLTPPALRLVVALPLIILGAVIAVASYRQWRACERAMRLGEPLRYTSLPRVLAGAIAVITATGLILAVVEASVR